MHIAIPINKKAMMTDWKINAKLDSRYVNNHETKDLYR